MVARNTTTYVNEPAVTGGNPILADNKVLFNDMLGTTLGAKDSKGGKTTQVAMTSFGDAKDSSGSNEDAFFTGKPYIGELGHAFLFRNYRSDLGKWQTADPMGYPDGWNQLAYCNNKFTYAVDPLGLYIGASGDASYKNFVNDVVNAAASSNTALGKNIKQMRDSGRTEHWTTVNQNDSCWPGTQPNSIVPGATVNIDNYDYTDSKGNTYDPIKALLHELDHASDPNNVDDATANKEADECGSPRKLDTLNRCKGLLN